MEAQYVGRRHAAGRGPGSTGTKLPLRARLVAPVAPDLERGRRVDTLTLGDNVNTRATSRPRRSPPRATPRRRTPTHVHRLGHHGRRLECVIQPTNNFGSFQVGNLITGTGIVANTVITAINGYGPGMLVVLSNAASTSATNTMTMTGDGRLDDRRQRRGRQRLRQLDRRLDAAVGGGRRRAAGRQVVTLKGVYVQD